MKPLSLVLALISLAACNCQPATGVVRCTSDTDCPSSQICHTLDATCVQCVTDANCTSGLCLADDTCSACGPNAPCPQGQTCGANGTCAAGCDSAMAGCPTGFCLPGSNLCVECRQDSDCGQGRVCDSNNQCRAGCSTNSPACMSGQVCNTDAGICVGCVTHFDCAQGVCDPSTSSCVGCLTNADCHAPDAICDVTTHTCVSCDVDTDCGPGNICHNHLCVPGCSTANPNCPNGRVCDPTGGQCVQCTSDAQCSGTTPRCDPADVCVQCMPGSTDNCPVDEYCRPDFICERGCKTGADCVSGVCLGDHSCSDCTMDSQCAAGKICQGGTCTDACSATNPCGTGQECCDQRCVDEQTDNGNCGACGNPCGTNETCCGGMCSALDTAAHCGACGTTCTTGQDCCGGSCQSTTTLTRCGSCTTACGTDQFCDGTQCQNVVFPNFCANKNVYAIHDGITLDDGATDVLASTIAANCPLSTNIVTGLQTNAAWVDQDAGTLLLGSGSTVVTAGGPVACKPVKWLESTSKSTKVYYASNNIDTFYFKKRIDNSIAASIAVSSCSQHHDILVVELVTDPSSGTLALIAYGVCVGGYGTQAAGWFYANEMLPNRMSYPDSWYVFDWQDTNMDSLPNASDTFTKLASGQ